MTREVDADMASGKVTTIAQHLEDAPDDICSQATDEDISRLTHLTETVKKSVTRVQHAMVPIVGFMQSK